MTDWHYSHSGGWRDDPVGEGLTGLPEDLSLAPRTQLRAFGSLTYPLRACAYPHKCIPIVT